MKRGGVEIIGGSERGKYYVWVISDIERKEEEGLESGEGRYLIGEGSSRFCYWRRAKKSTVKKESRTVFKSRFEVLPSRKRTKKG